MITEYTDLQRLNYNISCDFYILFEQICAKQSWAFSSLFIKNVEIQVEMFAIKYSTLLMFICSFTQQILIISYWEPDSVLAGK